MNADIDRARTSPEDCDLDDSSTELETLPGSFAASAEVGGADGGCVSVTARPPKWGMQSDEFFGTGCVVEADSPVFATPLPR
jgi:hypothetical protein